MIGRNEDGSWCREGKGETEVAILIQTVTEEGASVVVRRLKLRELKKMVLLLSKRVVLCPKLRFPLVNLTVMKKNLKLQVEMKVIVAEGEVPVREALREEYPLGRNVLADQGHVLRVIHVADLVLDLKVDPNLEVSLDPGLNLYQDRNPARGLLQVRDLILSQSLDHAPSQSLDHALSQNRDLVLSQSRVLFQGQNHGLYRGPSHDLVQNQNRCLPKGQNRVLLPDPNRGLLLDQNQNLILSQNLGAEVEVGLQIKQVVEAVQGLPVQHTVIMIVIKYIIVVFLD